MKKRLRKYGYKIVAWLIFVISIIYFYNRFSKFGSSFDFKSIILSLDKISFFLILTAVLLLLANWGMEAIKWQWINKHIEKFGFALSAKSVLMGVAVSTIFPNRTGEFIGKILILKKENRVKGIFSSLLASLAQFSVTLLAGLWSLFYLKNDVPISFAYILILTFVTLLFFFFFKRIILFIKNFLPKKWLSFIAFIKFYSFSDIFVILLLSAVRYSIFTFQLFLLLMVFGSQISFIEFLPLSAFSFMLTTIIPTTTLSELFVRSNVGVVIFSPYRIPDDTVILAYFFLWVINILLPSLLGFYFGLKKNWIYSSNNSDSSSGK